MDASLKQCPFCAHDDVQLRCNHGIYFIDCDDCGASGPTYATMDACIDDWNSVVRASAEPLPVPMGGQHFVQHNPAPNAAAPTAPSGQFGFTTVGAAQPPGANPLRAGLERAIEIVSMQDPYTQPGGTGAGLLGADEQTYYVRAFQDHIVDKLVAAIGEPVPTPPPDDDDLLRRAAKMIRDTAEFAGDDHSVGMCNCEDIRLAEEIEARLSPTKEESL